MKEEVKIENLENKKYWIWFSLIKNLGARRKLKLLEIYKNLETIYNLKKNELLKIEGIGEKIAKNILDENIKKEINRHITYMEKNDIDIISINEEKYPKILKEIYDTPISLYIKGNTEILNNKSIAIVGCRDATEYGKKAAKYFSYNLSKKGVNIISGLAKGIDSYAHIGNVCAQDEKRKEEDKLKISIQQDNIQYGKTIAVVGNGLDIVYPKENKYLFDKIIETGGAIISEYPLGTKPDKMNFPARNRIVSGISKGIIVIEAKEKSGTLITVDFALEQGRDVYVVPGNINSINSVGTNDLIKQGARLVTHYKDIEG